MSKLIVGSCGDGQSEPCPLQPPLRAMTCDLTWHREEGEDLKRRHAERGEGVLHSDDIHQDLLRHTRGPEQHEAKLGIGTNGSIILQDLL